MFQKTGGQVLVLLALVADGDHQLELGRTCSSQL